MKVLFFSDLHADKKSAEKIKEKSRNADLLVCAGDLSRMGQGFGDMITILATIPKTILLIPGNNETLEFVKEGTKDYENIIVIDGEVYQDLDLKFLGIGGGTISPFNTPNELSDEEFKDRLLPFSDDITVLVSHTPPKDTKLDKTSTGLHIGSFMVREWIMKNQPLLCCCGHVHENAGKEEKVGRTLCFNPGPEGVIKVL